MWVAMHLAFRNPDGFTQKWQVFDGVILNSSSPSKLGLTN
jgi:hypothetical protein